MVRPIPYIELGPASPLKRSISPEGTIPGIKFSRTPTLSAAAPTILLLKNPDRAPPAPPKIEPSAAFGSASIFNPPVPSFDSPTSKSLCNFTSLLPIGDAGSFLISNLS